MSDLADRLRNIASKATEGPWTHDDGRPWVWNDELCVASGWREQEARFVATFDPVLVAAMLDVIDAADWVVNRPDGHGEFYYPDLHTALARFRQVAG